MTWTSLMVSLDLGQSNTAVLEVARSLARRFEAHVTGMAGAHLFRSVFVDGYAADDIFQMEAAEIDRQMSRTQSEFRKALEGRSDKVAWRATERFESIAEFAARQARGVDVIVTAVATAEYPGTSRAVQVADLIMRSGRPVLVVPAGASAAKFESVMIAWKDTREARRAVADALPLLKRARQVVVVSVVAAAQLREAHASLDDVVAWLARHGIVAQSLVEVANLDDDDQLGNIAAARRIDLVVAGAYGHSRLRESILGGVTRSLLDRGQCCSLLSH